MKIAVLMILLMIIHPAIVFGNISGRVISESDSTVLSGASIFISGTSLGAVSDQTGEFVLPELSPGEYELIIEYVGYAQKLINVTVPFEESYLTIYLNQEIVSGPIVS